MAKFSLARVPYYIAVAIFMGLVALVSYVNNTTSTGLMSDAHLAMLVVTGCLTCLSIFYAFRAQSGDDDDADAEIAGLPVGKVYYYYAVLAIAAWRAVVGYQLNHNAVGIESTYGILWIGGSVALALFTWANYRSYTKKIAPVISASVYSRPPHVD